MLEAVVAPLLPEIARSRRRGPAAAHRGNVSQSLHDGCYRGGYLGVVRGRHVPFPRQGVPTADQLCSRRTGKRSTGLRPPAKARRARSWTSGCGAQGLPGARRTVLLMAAMVAVFMALLHSHRPEIREPYSSRLALRCSSWKDGRAGWAQAVGVALLAAFKPRPEFHRTRLRLTRSPAPRRCAPRGSPFLRPSRGYARVYCRLLYLEISSPDSLSRARRVAMMLSWASCCSASPLSTELFTASLLKLTTGGTPPTGPRCAPE